MERMDEQESAQQAMDEIMRNLSPYPFPYMRGHISTLGGVTRLSMQLTVSLDEKTTWKNHILENSRYAKLSISNEGMLQVISSDRMIKLRKSKVKSIYNAITKLHMWGERALALKS